MRRAGRFLRARSDPAVQRTGRARADSSSERSTGGSGARLAPVGAAPCEMSTGGPGRKRCLRQEGQTMAGGAREAQRAGGEQGASRLGPWHRETPIGSWVIRLPRGKREGQPEYPLRNPCSNASKTPELPRSP